jgi:hypothetical protein
VDGVLGDTWTWNGTNWTQLAPSTSPSARYGSAFVFDTAENQMVLFGGDNSSGTLADTWTWNGTTWAELSPATVPGGRFYAGADYDSLHHLFVMFAGGYGTTHGDIYLDDTWVWF